MPFGGPPDDNPEHEPTLYSLMQDEAYLQSAVVLAASSALEFGFPDEAESTLRRVEADAKKEALTSSSLTETATRNLGHIAALRDFGFYGSEED